MPRRVVEMLNGVVKAEGVEAGVAFGDDRRELGEHPPVLGTERLRPGWMDVEVCHRSLADLGDEEAVGHLPQLVGEALVGSDAVLVETHVLTTRSHRRRPRANGVRPESV